MPTKVKVQAKDVASAIAQGLRELGLRRDQVEVSVLEHPKKGFLGFGAKPAVVEIRQKRWSAAELDAQIYMDVPRGKKRGSRGVSRGGKQRRGHERDAYASSRPERAEGGKRRGRKFDRAPRAEARDKAPKANETQLLPCERIQNAIIPENLQAPMQEAKQYLGDMLALMGVKTENLNVWWDERQQRVLLTFDCDHPAIVIGKEGKTLEAVQYLCTLALSRHFDKPISVITDTQNYWRKAEDKIDAEIARGVAAVEAGASIFRFRPMSAQLRRYIHRELEGSSSVATSSEGEGKWRKVTLRPKAKDAAQTAAASTALTEPVQEKEINAVSASSSCCACEEKTETSCSCGCDRQTSYAAQPVYAETPCCAEQGVSCDLAVREVCACACENHTRAEEPSSETVAPQSAPEENAACDGVTCGCAADTQSSCACTAETEVPPQPQASAETETVPAGNIQTPADDLGGTCTPEIARNCGQGETETGCACGPLFEAAAEENCQDVK